MNRLKGVLFAGLAIVVLYAGAAGACRKDYDTTPTEPTHTASPTAVPTQSIDDIITPAATAVPTATPASTATSSPTPIVAPTPALETIIYQKLLDNVPAIKEFDNDEIHRRVINLAVAQIRDDIYSNKLDSATVQIGDKTYNAWDYITNAIKFVLPGLSKADLSKYSDMDLRQILLPPQLRTVDIKRLIAERGINYTVSGLEIAIKNVTPDDSLGGKSPQEWLREEMMRDLNDKNSKGYEEGIYNSTGAARIAWPNSMGVAFQEIRSDMLAKGETEPFFLIGWSVYKVGEQRSNQLAPLVSRAMEKPLAAYPGEANYPTGTAIHTEPWVSYKGRLIGAWMFEEVFLRDYERSTWPDFKGKISKPNITLLGPDGKLYNPYTLKPIPN